METKKVDEKALAAEKADENSDKDIEEQLAALEAEKKKVGFID